MGSYTVVGNLGADPQLRWNPSGGAWATFTICETDRVVDRESGQWRDGPATWWEVKCSGPLAEHVAQSLRKGQRAFVLGQVGEEHWTAQDGTPRSRKRLRASAVGPDLRWGVTSFALRSRDEGLVAGPGVDRATGVISDPWDVPAQGGTPAAESFRAEGAGDDEDGGVRDVDGLDGDGLEGDGAEGSGTRAALGATA